MGNARLQVLGSSFLKPPLSGEVSLFPLHLFFLLCYTFIYTTYYILMDLYVKKTTPCQPRLYQKSC